MKVLAVIGCGRIARTAHLPALSKIEGVRIKYACDTLLEKAKKIKEDFPIVENVTEDPEVVFADKEVDAVYILTPNFAHYELTMAALKAGKHVFCEKPITVNYELSKEMQREANNQGKILNIGVCNRFSKSVEMLEQMNREGKFGKIYNVYCSFRSCRSIPGLGGAFTTKSQSGGGVLIDWGVHFLDLVLYVLGGAEIKTVSCNAYSEMAKNMKDYKYNDMWAKDTADIENGTNDVDDMVTGFIRTDKASITLNGAWAENLDQYEMFVDFLGDKGGARLDYGGKFTFFDGQTLKTTAPEYELNVYYETEDASFVDSITTGKKTKANIDEVITVAKLMDMMYKSSELGEEVKSL